MPGMPVRVEGFHGEILGIGETARQFHRALTQSGHAVEAHALDRRLRPAAQAPDSEALRLTHLNPDQLLEHSMRIASDRERRLPHVGYWVWELPRAPARWRAASRLVDRVWAPSRFAAEAIGAQLRDTPVSVLPPPVFAHPPAGPTPDLGLPGEAVRILAVCDLRSSAARKNPMGALEAFERAVRAGMAPAVLVLKITAAGQYPAVLDGLRARTAGRSDIRLVTETLSEEAMQGLIETCDIALCLHRSEGFGLLAAQAAWRGKPAIATNWSAPAEFLAPDGAGLVDYTLVPVEDPQGIYPRGQVWAEPDIDHAADWLVRLAGDADLRRRMGTAARAHARDLLGPEAWQARFTALLDEMAAERAPVRRTSAAR